MKLAVLVAAIRVCPGIHKVTVRNWHYSEGWACPTSEWHWLPVVQLPLDEGENFFRARYALLYTAFGSGHTTPKYLVSALVQNWWTRDRWDGCWLVITLKFSIPKFSFQCQELCVEIWMNSNYDLLFMSPLLFVFRNSPWSDAETSFSNSPVNRLDWRGSIVIYVRSNVVATNVDPIPCLVGKKLHGEESGNEA